MAEGVDLKGLLRDLRSAGPIDRVRLLGHGLTALRRLSPFDRKVLLRMAGFEGAEALVERLAAGDEETANALQRVLARLEERPASLKETVHALADPKRRGEALDRILAEVDETLAEPPPPPPPPEPEPAAEPATEAVPAPVGARVEPPPLEPSEEEPSEEEPPEREPPPPPEPEPQPPEPVPLPPPAPLPVPEPPPLPAAAPEEIAGAAPSATNVLEELRRLRHRLAAGERPDAAAVADLIEHRLPYPWARRRALQAWLAAGAPESLPAALALLDHIDSPADRLWCLTALARSRPWPEEDRPLFLAAAPTPAAHRRLESLLQRHPAEHERSLHE